MARTTLKSQAIIIAQLTADLNDSRTQVGVLMSALEESNQRARSLQDGIDNGNMFSAKEVEELCTLAVQDHIDEQRILANAKPASKPKSPSPKPTVPAQVIATPEAQEAMAMFLKCTPAQRSAVVKFVGAKVVTLANILEVQAKWHSRSQCASPKDIYTSEYLVG